MKIHRLLEIITLLLTKNKVTAAELAERFEVSQRTIYRDIDTLGEAGIPLYTLRGSGGGITIMENYTMDRTILTDQEKKTILLALRSLKSIEYLNVDMLIQKLSAIFQSKIEDWITIDYSPWGKRSELHGIAEQIKEAIQQKIIIEIEYVNRENRRSRRRIEPYNLLFKSHTWYLRAYCQQKEAPRTFKLTRIRSITLLDDHFISDSSRHAHWEESQADEEQTSFCQMEFLFTDKVMHRLYDNFDDSLIKDNGDSTYSVEVTYPEDDWLYGYLLSFGDELTVVKPPHLRKILKEYGRKIAKLYR